MSKLPLTQAPFASTLMGVLKGALDFYGEDYAQPVLFGGSGHAFLLNIHEALCPSGPYCWRFEPVQHLLSNLGIEIEELGFFDKTAPASERASVEKRLREALEDGVPCSLLNMENQLIAGFDGEGFLLTRPWDKPMEITPTRLSFGSWAEFHDEVHASFFILRKTPPAPINETISASIRYACGLYSAPERHSFPHYGIGPRGFDLWLDAIDEHGSSHGHWWNATVWSESRHMAAKYMEWIGNRIPEKKQQCLRANTLFEQVSQCLAKAADRELPIPEKRESLEVARAADADAFNLLTQAFL